MLQPAACPHLRHDENISLRNDTDSFNTIKSSSGPARPSRKSIFSPLSFSLPLPFWHRCRKLCFEARPVRSPVYFRITSRGASQGFLSPRICKRRHMNLGQLLKFRYGACSACQPLVLLPPPQALYKLGRDNGSQRRSGTWIVKTGRLIKPNEFPFPHQRSHRRCRASCPCSLMMLARPLFNELHSFCFLRGHVACLDRERHLPSQHMGDAGPSKKRD